MRIIYSVLGKDLNRVPLEFQVATKICEIVRSLIDDLVPYNSNSIDNALELLQSCTKQSIHRCIPYYILGCVSLWPTKTRCCKQKDNNKAKHNPENSHITLNILPMRTNFPPVCLWFTEIELCYNGPHYSSQKLGYVYYTWRIALKKQPDKNWHNEPQNWMLLCLMTRGEIE